MKNILLLCLLVSSMGFSQDPSFQDSSDEKHYNNFDKVINIKNSDLSYGALFVKKYNSSNENHYLFKSNEFLDGNVIYNNQEYFNLKLKYNLIEDDLIIKIDNQKSLSQIILQPHLITSFYIDKHYFISDSNYGYVEILANVNENLFFKKHRKEKLKKLDKQRTYYKYKNKNTYILRHEDKYVKIKKTKDFLTIYPKQKKRINSFRKKNNYLYKNNKEQYFTKLFLSLNAKNSDK